MQNNLKQEKIQDIENNNKSLVELEALTCNVVIENEAELNDASDLLKAVKFRIKMIEDQRKKYTKPLNDVVKDLNAEFKPFKERAEIVKRDIEKGILEYNKKREEQLRIEAEKKRQEEIEKARQEAERNKALNEVFGDKSKAIMAEVHEKQAEKLEQKELKIDTAVRTEKGTTSIRKVWTYEIISEDNIPVDYQSPDHKKIMDAIKDGKRDIPGLKIYQKESIMSR
jgi:hypothetical protein